MTCCLVKNRKTLRTGYRPNFPASAFWLLAAWLLTGLAFAGQPAAWPLAAANTGSCSDRTDPSSCEGFELLDDILNFMAMLVIPIVVIMIIVGGIQYSMAGGNAEALKEARNRIFKAIVALICFAGLWSFLKWLLPGGLA